MKLQSDEVVAQMAHFAPKTRCYYGLCKCHCPLQILPLNEDRCSLCSASHFISLYGQFVLILFNKVMYFDTNFMSFFQEIAVSVPASLKDIIHSNDGWVCK